MDKKKKIVLTTGVGALSVIVVAGSAFALFTDKADDALIGTAGTVDVNVADFKLSDNDNINPGDNDPDLPTEYIPTEGDPLYDPTNPTKAVPVKTTDHNLTFTVTNDGTKSIRTRHTLVVSVHDDNGATLDARRLQLYEMLDLTGAAKTKAENELTGKTYIYEADGAEQRVDNVEAIPDGVTVKAIEYRFTPDVFEGTGLSAEKEPELANAVRADGGAATKDYLYDLALDMETPNSYQGASVSIEATIEAMQYRNTIQDDWKTVSTKTFSATVAGTSDNQVPDRLTD